jgi:tetratricopeptide (TPR) repeat protein
VKPQSPDQPSAREPRDLDGILERNVSSLLGSGGDPPRLPEPARARMRAHLVARFAAPARRRSPALAVGLGLAAAAAAAAIVTRVVGDDPGSPGGAPGRALADGTTWVTAPGGRVDVLGPRHVRVTGAALLDVAPGPRFTVDTAAGAIEVLGTRFLVDAAPARTTTAVIRGAVRLGTAAGAVQLHAGDQGVAEPGQVPTRGPAPRLSHLVSWAAAARRAEDAAPRPLRNGTLFAREPNRPSVPESPLPIRELVVDAVVEDQVARVALDQTFHNPAPQIMEGMYRFAIPPDASLQRLAMYVEGRLTEAAVVERMAARRIYEDVVYRRLDPALLEWAGTGRLALRVYPLPARQDKRLLLAYTQSLPRLYDDWALTVPLPEVDLPVGELRIAVRVKGCANCEIASPSHAIEVRRDGEDTVVTHRARSVRIGDSLVLRVRDARRGAAATVHTAAAPGGGPAERYLRVRARPELPAAQRAYRPRTWVILDDVSASRGPAELRAQAELVDAFLRELDEDDRVAVIAFDVEARTALPATRVRDVDRAAVRRALAAEGGVGATHFEAGIDAALAQLAGVAPADARVVYLGDGVITSGSRDLAAVRARIAGRAQLVGVGVGDGVDAPALEALAAATGGYATSIDLADDLRWRAFDLVAALHTPRVVGLAARIVDDAGAPIAATTYLRAGQLAAGEELEVVARLAGAGEPAAVELTGSIDGAPWSLRVPVAGGRAGAGYLPRLWAHRHIAARLLAKHEPVAVAPCAAAPAAAGRRGPRPPQPACLTEAEAREARDEAIRKEVVALGKRFFLLSRHTSLLVLENDAMYKRYGVTEGAGDTWAPYAAPPAIPVAPAPGPAVAEDAELVRSPSAALGADPVAAGALGDELMDHDDAPLREESWAGALSAGAGDAWIGPPTTIAKHACCTTPRSRASLGLADLGPLPVERAARSSASAEQAQQWAPEPEEARAAGGGGLEENKASTITTSALAGFAAGRGARISRWGQPAPDALSRTRWPHRSRRLASGMAFLAPTAPAYQDLSAFVPALFADDFDAARAELRAMASGEAHPIDDAARALLERARGALPAGVYRWGDREIAVDAARRLGLRRATGADLVETASYDGRSFTRRYAELGLTVARPVGADAVALGLAYFPLWIAEPAHYARWLAVRASGPRQVTLAVPAAGGAPERPVLVLDFDDQDRLVAISGARGGAIARVTWGDRGPVAAWLGGAAVAVALTAAPIPDAVAWAHGAAGAAAGGATDEVVVELPGRLPAFWEVQAAAAPAGSPAWRRAQRQRLVSLAATADHAGLLAVYEALRAAGGVARGDLVLASAALGGELPAARLAAALAPHRAASPALVSYLEGGRAAGAGGRRAAAGPAPAPAPGLIGALGALRDAAALAAAGQGRAAVEVLIALGPRAPDLRAAGAALLSARDGVPATEVARAWDAAAAGPLRNTARAQAALVLASRGEREAAAARVAALIASLDLTAPPPDFGSLQYVVRASRRGELGWALLARQWREVAIGGDRLDHLLALVPPARGQPEVAPLLARAAQVAGADPDAIAAVGAAAIAADQLALARQLLEPALARRPPPALLRLAARLARLERRPAEALAHLVAAQAAGADDAVALDAVRSELGEILELCRALVDASAPGSAERASAVSTALEWARRWRAIDPASAAIEPTVARTLLAAGQPAAARRYLSTLIERDPMSGEPYQAVAQLLAEAGAVAEALPYWQQAIVLDQTSPEPRLRKAQALIALGQTAEADRLLAQIVGRSWHERHEWTVQQARALAARGE